MKGIAEKLRTKALKQTPGELTYQPLFYKQGLKADDMALETLLKLPGTKVHDTISDQVTELIKVKNPAKKFSKSELDAAVKKRLGPNPAAYGVWVYYPWSGRLVHLLDKNEFVLVRTSRNVYKITPSEREILSKKKIGVVGLSVGQSVSVTLAMERVCGELRLADFDVLELTNLNRIRTGVHNLNLKKVYSVAREISEIDPYIKVKCFTDGLHEKNMQRFFMAGGKLDLLVEESDGFDIKVLCRYKARELKVPVIMEASDRCMVDVERFDLEPKRSILHGLLDHLRVDELKKLKTTEEKIPYMLDILGIESCSKRLRASMLEIEQSINTWPQLASAVTMGGGITADVCRRMLLNQFTQSGRYYVDIEEQICNKPTNRPPSEIAANIGVASETSFNMDFALAADPEDLELNESRIKELVESACKAPSGGNSQPWRWVYRDKILYLYNPYTPDSSLLDYDSTASLIAEGAALENLFTHAALMDVDCKTEFFPDKGNRQLVAALRFRSLKGKKPGLKNRFSAVGLRMTNRTIAGRTPIDEIVLQNMVHAVREIDGADLIFITDAGELQKAGDVLGELEKIRLMDSSGHRDFVREMRWTKTEAEQSRDGVDIRTVDLTNSELAGFNIARNGEVVSLVNEWNGGGAFCKLTRKAIEGAGAVGIISINGTAQTDYLKAGMALEKAWLEANLNGVSFHPVSAGLFLYARLIRGKGHGLEAKTCERLWALRPQFERMFCLREKSKEMFIFRLTNCGIPKVRSLRKTVEEMLICL